MCPKKEISHLGVIYLRKPVNPEFNNNNNAKDDCG
jgi:hypothetical protein